MIVQELFSKKNNSFFSWAIRMFTKPLVKHLEFARIPSHVSIRKGQFIYESTFFSGVRVLPFDVWKKTNVIIDIRKKSIVFTESQFEKVFVDIWGKKYDWKGVLFWALCVIKFVAFKKPIPKRNKWNHPDKYFCSEANGRLFGLDYQMKAPVQLMHEACPDN